MRYITSIILLISIFSAASSYSLEITFKPNADIVNNNVLLGDIVTFDESSDVTEVLSAKIIGKAPEPGEISYLSSREIIRNILRKTTLSPSTLWSGSATVKVIRLGQKIGPADIKKAISEYLGNNKNNLPNAEISFEPHSLPLPFMIPKGNITWEVIPSNPRILHSTRFSLIIRVDDRVRKNFSIPGSVKALAPIAVATKNIKRGQILSPDNTVLTVKNITQHKNPCFSLRKILGKRIKHTIRAGNVIQTEDVEIPPLVLKGQLVKIIFQQGPLYITASGIARMSGKLNDIIRVQNAKSRKLIFCRVTAPGIVEVII